MVENMFSFLTYFYFICLVILLLNNKIVKRDKPLDLSRVDWGCKWYIYLDDRWWISVRMLLLIQVVLLIFALNEIL